MFILKLLPEIQIELLSHSTNFTTISEAATEATQIEEKLHHEQQQGGVKPNWKWPTDEQTLGQPPFKHWKFQPKNKTEPQASNMTDLHSNDKKLKQGKDGRKPHEPPGPCHCRGNHWFSKCPDKEKGKSITKEKQEKST